MIETIRKIFVEETTGQLSDIARMLDNAPEIEVTPLVIEKVFLAMHTIKGSGPMFGFANLPMASMPVEKAFAKIKTGEIAYSPEIGEKTNSMIKLIMEALHRNSDEHLPNIVANNELVNYFKNIGS